MSGKISFALSIVLKVGLFLPNSSLWQGRGFVVHFLLSFSFFDSIFFIIIESFRLNFLWSS